MTASENQNVRTSPLLSCSHLTCVAMWCESSSCTFSERSVRTSNEWFDAASARKADSCALLKKSISTVTSDDSST